MTRWCSLCERKVEECPHFEEAPKGFIESIHRKAVDSIALREDVGLSNDFNEESEVLGDPIADFLERKKKHDDLLRRLTKKIDPGPIRSSLYGSPLLLPHSRPTPSPSATLLRDQQRLVLLSFTAIIHAFAIANVMVQPQIPVDLRRLVYAGPARTFALEDISIGKNSIFGAPGGRIPMETFPPHPTGEDPIDNLDGCEPVHVSMLINIRVANLTHSSQTFIALMYARELREERTRMTMRELSDDNLQFLMIVS